MTLKRTISASLSQTRRPLAAIVSPIRRINSATPSDSDPVMDGSASSGSSSSYARGDHVHPSDTSKLNAPSGGTAGQVLKKTSNGVEWGDEVFIAVYGTATSAQIDAAYQAGHLCVC